MSIRGLTVCVIAMSVLIDAPRAHAEEEAATPTVAQLTAALQAEQVAHRRTQEQLTALQAEHARTRQQLAMARKRVRPASYPKGLGNAPNGPRSVPSKVSISKLPSILNGLIRTAPTTDGQTVPGFVHVPALRELMLSESGSIADAAVTLAKQLKVADKKARTLMVARDIEAGRATESDLQAHAANVLPEMCRRLAAASRLPKNFESAMQTLLASAPLDVVRGVLPSIARAGRQGFGDARPEAVRAIWSRLQGVASARK